VRCYKLKKLFVGNLPYEASAQQLSEWFANAGFITASAIVERDRFTGGSRGFGYVDLSEQSADTAIKKCNGRDFQGRTLVISQAQPSNRTVRSFSTELAPASLDLHRAR
jgi:RNA recognition motif-containing protein